VKLKKANEKKNATFLMQLQTIFHRKENKIKYNSKTSSWNSKVLILQEQFSVSDSIRIFDLFEVINSLSHNFTKL
jgi:hypothetical protein